MVVVDASVAAKWVLPEEHAPEAALLLSGAWALHAPSHWLGEAMTAVWSATRARDAITPAQCRDRVAFLRGSAVRETPLRDVAGDAVDLALRLDLTPYDAAYLALALRLGVPVVTADTRMRRKCAAGGFSASVLWVAGLGAAPP